MSPTAAPGVVLDHREAVMGTGARIVVRGADHERAAEAAARAMTWLHQVDATFSTYREDSEIRRIDAGTLAAADSSPEVRAVLDLCVELHDRTGGWFDACATGRLDPSGVVKGWAVDRASAILADAGCCHHLIECGGDIRLGSESAGGDGTVDASWQVGVVHPHRLDAFCAVVQLDSGAVATSGSYERGWHVVDPRRGVPAHELAAVTIVGPDLTTADAYATAAMAMGAEALEWLPLQHGWDWLVIDEHGSGWTSPGFDAMCAPFAAA